MKGKKIKIRGLDIHGDWYHGLLSYIPPQSPLYNGHSGYCISDENGRAYAHPVVGDTVGQSTGIKDMHGTEIYNGDIIEIVKLHDGHEQYWSQSTGSAIPTQVEWDEKPTKVENTTRFL